MAQSDLPVSSLNATEPRLVLERIVTYCRVSLSDLTLICMEMDESVLIQNDL